MDAAVVSGLSAVFGSMVGGCATIATAWVTQKTQSRRESAAAEIRKRESLYTEFIVECSKLAIDALEHTLDDPTKLIQLYALQNRIGLVATNAVVVAAEQAMDHILDLYFQPNISREEFRHLALSHPNTMKPFSEASRRELDSLRRPQ